MSGAGRSVPPPEIHAKLVLLTSGTTGTPKGAPRSLSRSLAPVGAVLSKVPYKSGESTYVAPPMFHGCGKLANMSLTESAKVRAWSLAALAGLVPAPSRNVRAASMKRSAESATGAVNCAASACEICVARLLRLLRSAARPALVMDTELCRPSSGS